MLAMLGAGSGTGGIMLAARGARQTQRRTANLVLLMASIFTARGTCCSIPLQPTATDLAAAKARGSIALWGVSRPRARPVQPWELRLFFPQRSDGDMQQQLGLRTQVDADRTIMSIAGVAVLGVVASLALLDGSSAAPDPVRTGLGYAAAATPFLAISANVVLPDQTRALLVNAWRLNPTYRRRQTYHEAGHFLIGYLLGLEVEGYDAATGAGASSAVRFSRADAVDARSHATLDGLAVLSMGGVAAEVIACGDAEGGIADVAQLRALMAAASPPIATKLEQDDRVRWGTLMALTLLQQHRAALDALAVAFDDAASVGECVTAIEAAASSATAAGAQQNGPR